MYRANLSFDLKTAREISCCSDDVEGSIRESYDVDDWQQRISEYEFRKVFSEIQANYTTEDCCLCYPRGSQEGASQPRPSKVQQPLAREPRCQVRLRM